MPTDIQITESPARILRQLLVDLGQVVMPVTPTAITPWQGNVNVEPNAPDDVVTIYNTESLEDGRVAFDGSRVEHPGIQVRVRSTLDTVGYPKARDICIALDGVLRRIVTVNSVLFLVQEVARTGNVIPVGYDTPTSKRWVYTINMVFTVRGPQGIVLTDDGPTILTVG